MCYETISLNERSAYDQSRCAKHSPLSYVAAYEVARAILLKISTSISLNGYINALLYIISRMKRSLDGISIQGPNLLSILNAIAPHDVVSWAALAQAHHKRNNNARLAGSHVHKARYA